MDFELARFNMIEQQIRPWDVLDPVVLETLRRVRREGFVSAAQAALAFSDTELPLPNGQQMFSPKVEARILQALGVRTGDDILEVGSGSGYMAALLAERGQWVRSLDIDPVLVNLAADNLTKNGVDNVIVEQADGLAGWPSGAPYDVIVLSGSVREVPQVLLDQLKLGGRLFAFVGSAPVFQGTLVRRTTATHWQRSVLFEGFATPLRGDAAAKFEF